MDKKAPNLIPSGIEPVDKLMGGLQNGQLYLVHGEASGKSLFGIKFLIEGLKRGENGALVIRYSPEDAVRRFARLGYDCLEDVYSGRLVILEYSDDIIQQISRLRELTPVLRELEWLLGETKPQRLIFDPFTSLVAGEGDLKSRVREFTDWASSFGATVIFIANGGDDVVEGIKPHTAEVFRFEVREVHEHATRFVAFEKSPAIPDHAIEVDPSRGIFLLERAKIQEHFFSMFQATPSNAESNQAAKPAPATIEHEALESTAEEPAPAQQPAPASRDKSIETVAGAPTPPEIGGEKEPSDFEIIAAKLRERGGTQPRGTRPTAESGPPATTKLSAGAGPRPDQPSAPPAQTPTGVRADFIESQSDVFADLVDELADALAPLDLDEHVDLVEQAGDHKTAESPASAGQPAAGARPAQPPASEPVEAQSHGEAPPERRHIRASDLKIDSTRAARAAEILLRPPESQTELPVPPRKAAPTDAPAPASIQPKDFNVLIIEDDPVTREIIAHTLSDYTVDIVSDGVSGLAKLISVRPDLVVLDLDLPIIDGFKILEHIRLSLNVPVIIVSGSRVRATDRVLAAEMGADYYLTKPFSVIELQHKARQLVARYRGINSWIVSSNAAGGAHDSPAGESAAGPPAEPVVVSGDPEVEQFMPYRDFASKVEERVKKAMDSGAAFSIVGCRLSQMTANAGRPALKLYEIARALVRESDLMSTNSRNDLVILLTDANSAGARAFISRLREQVLNEMNQEPSVWVRSFPDLEESTEATASAFKPDNGSRAKRRVSDNPDGAEKTDAPADVQKKPDPREPFIDFLENL
jgi:CheY-like chemotaxis protein/KaiC/GvpD/RAD55 family RecA-like ATPase